MGKDQGGVPGHQSTRPKARNLDASAAPPSMLPVFKGVVAEAESHCAWIDDADDDRPARLYRRRRGTAGPQGTTATATGTATIGGFTPRGRWIRAGTSPACSWAPPPRPRRLQGPCHGRAAGDRAGRPDQRGAPEGRRRQRNLQPGVNGHNRLHRHRLPGRFNLTYGHRAGKPQAMLPSPTVSPQGTTSRLPGEAFMLLTDVENVAGAVG